MCYLFVKLYAYVTVKFVCECHISNLTGVQTIRNLPIFIKLQSKIDTVGLYRPGVATDRDLHGLLLILSHITLNNLKPERCMMSNLVYTDLKLLMLFFGGFFHRTALLHVINRFYICVRLVHIIYTNALY